MTCGYCQFTNTDEDHRCRRCGRRLTGTAVAAPAHLASEHARIAIRVLGANALAPAPSPAAQTEIGQSATVTIRQSATVTPQKPRAPEISMDAAATLDSLPRKTVARGIAQDFQPSLFGAELQPKIIPFDTLPRASAAAALQEPAPIAEVRPAQKPKTTARKSAPPAEDPQATLDFLPAAKPAPRTLKTSAEAVIFCDALAASPIHRATAASIDLALILSAFGAVLFIFNALAKPAHFTRGTFAMLGMMLGITALFYGLLFAIAGTVTPGMRWTHLRLINFDGFPLDGRNRALRVAGSWISVLSGGIGIFWALLDEENLTWHDHISRSFPTLRESDSIVVRPGHKRQP